MNKTEIDTVATQAFVFDDYAFRTIFINGETWFCAKDVCQILEYKNSRKAIIDNCNKAGVTNSYIRSGGQYREMQFINEPNLYRLISRSQKPEAEKFERWIFEEVLPSLRKTGSYIMEGSNPANINASTAAEARRWLLMCQKEWRYATGVFYYQVFSGLCKSMGVECPPYDSIRAQPPMLIPTPIHEAEFHYDSGGNDEITPEELALRDGVDPQCFN